LGLAASEALSEVSASANLRVELARADQASGSVSVLSGRDRRGRRSLRRTFSAGTRRYSIRQESMSAWLEGGDQIFIEGFRFRILLELLFGRRTYIRQ
jgi:hypothetical protein